MAGLGLIDRGRRHSTSHTDITHEMHRALALLLMLGVRRWLVREA